MVAGALNDALGVQKLKAGRAGLASLYRLLGCVGTGFATRELRAEEGRPLIEGKIAMGASARVGHSVHVPERDDVIGTSGGEDAVVVADGAGGD